MALRFLGQSWPSLVARASHMGSQRSLFPRQGQAVNAVPFLLTAASPQENQRPVHVAIRVTAKRRTDVQRKDVGYEGDTRTSVKGKQTSDNCLKFLKTGQPKKKTFPRL